jgi:hypothetical protein
MRRGDLLFAATGFWVGGLVGKSRPDSGPCFGCLHHFHSIQKSFPPFTLNIPKNGVRVPSKRLPLDFNQKARNPVEVLLAGSIKSLKKKSGIWQFKFYLLISRLTLIISDLFGYFSIFFFFRNL